MLSFEVSDIPCFDCIVSAYFGTGYFNIMAVVFVAGWLGRLAENESFH